MGGTKSDDSTGSSGAEVTIPADLAGAVAAACRLNRIESQDLVERALRSYLRSDGLCEAVFQNAPLCGLMEGIYRAGTSLRDLLQHGDFGLGTFNDLDGEMVLLDGRFYQLRADGKAYRPDPDCLTPFATVTRFSPFITETVAGPLDYTALRGLLEGLLPSENSLYAVRVDGAFDHVRVRSVPPQPEGRPLVEVAREQTEFTVDSLSGTLAGFWFPSFLEGVNVPGWHLHFLDSERAWGGHLLECGARDLTVSLQHVPRLSMDLPVTLDFMTTRFGTRDLAAEIAEAERGR